MDERLDKIIKLLEICPECISGFIKAPVFKTNKLSGQAVYPPSYVDVTDTKTKSQIVKCTNERCQNNITFDNPYYLEYDPPQQKEKVLENEYELFG
jgi:hypothetical protein